MADIETRRDVDQALVEYRTLDGECARCRQELHPDWQFCAHCDARLATHCPECAVALPPAGSTHCGHCGILLPGAGARAD